MSHFFLKASLTVHEESCRSSLEVLSRLSEVDEQGVSGRVSLPYPLRMIHNNAVCLVLRRKTLNVKEKYVLYLMGREGLSRTVASHSPVRVNPSHTCLRRACLKTLQKILGESFVNPNKSIINHYPHLESFPT